MSQTWIDFGVGLLVGGLSISAGWGLFWLAISTTGLMRGTCGWRVVLNSLAVGGLPLLLIGGAVWWGIGESGVTPVFGMGLGVIPMVILGIGFRQAPDGRRAWVHMFAGVRHLKDELLGCHQQCSGCSEGHQH
jgi:hypothetical protein